MLRGGSGAWLGAWRTCGALGGSDGSSDDRLRISGNPLRLGERDVFGHTVVAYLWSAGHVPEPVDFAVAGEVPVAVKAGIWSPIDMGHSILEGAQPLLDTALQASDLKAALRPGGRGLESDFIFDQMTAVSGLTRFRQHHSSYPSLPRRNTSSRAWGVDCCLPWEEGWKEVAVGCWRVVRAVRQHTQSEITAVMVGIVSAPAP